MKPATKGFDLRDRRVRRILALFCLGLFLLLQTFASSGALHRAIHADADLPGHHCLITLLAQGQVDAPTAWVGVGPFVCALIFSLPFLLPEFLSSFDYRLSPSRAPPRS